MVGLHNQVHLSFLIVGHTKFTPDWCFGLFKQRFRRTKVSCLSDLEQVVNISAEANIAQVVGTQCGEVVVPTYNWSAMFTGRLKKLKGIKKYHHFSITSTTPRSVCVKIESDSDEEHIALLTDHTWAPSQHNLPAVVVPSGLSIERQWYLHNHIAEYCPEEVRDVVCSLALNPLPTTTTPLPETSTTLPVSTSHWSGTTSSTAAEHQPQAKPARVCRKCNTPGHNARTCGKWLFFSHSLSPPPLLHRLLLHHAHTSLDVTQVNESI